MPVSKKIPPTTQENKENLKIVVKRYEFLSFFVDFVLFM